MKYMLLMNVPGGSYQIASWAAADITAHIAFMREFTKKLDAAGELVGAAGLSGPDQAKRVRAGGNAPITDGVFPASKELKPSLQDQVDFALTCLRRHRTEATLKGMARHAIPSNQAYGVAMKTVHHAAEARFAAVLC